MNRNMKINTYQFCLFVMLSLSSMAMSVAFAAPDFPPPPGAKVTWVGKDMVWNGIPMNVRKFTTNKKRNKVIDFYKQKWAEPVEEGAPGFIEQKMPDGWMISRLKDDYLMSVYIKSSALENAWGYLGKSNLANGKAGTSYGPKFPKMNGSVVVNEVKHNDPYRDARTVMLRNPFSVSSNVEYYRSHYAGRGWNIGVDKEISNGKLHTITATKRGAEVSVVIAKTNSGSQVVANIVE